MVAVRVTRSLIERTIAFLMLIGGFLAIFFTYSPRTLHVYGMSNSIVHADGPLSCSPSYSCGQYCLGDCLHDCIDVACESGETCDGISCDGPGEGTGEGTGEGGAEGVGGGTGGGGADGGGGGKLICTELFRQGMLPADWYEADERFAKMVPHHVREGYQWWARPIVRGMRRSRKFTIVVHAIAKPWAQQMAFQMGVAEQASFVGAFLMIVAVPICGAIGRVLQLVRESKVQTAFS